MYGLPWMNEVVTSKPQSHPCIMWGLEMTEFTSNRDEASALHCVLGFETDTVEYVAKRIYDIALQIVVQSFP